MNEPVHVIGMGLGPADLTASHLALIERAAVLVGGKRHLSYFKDAKALKKEISSPVSGVLDFVEQYMAEGLVVVLASGDPLFFGIGKTLITRLGPDKVIIHPNVTSMAAAFARLKLPWQDAAWVSLHGRDNMPALARAMDDKDLLCVLTDPENDPLAVKKQVDAHNYAWQMWVLENLGAPEEKIFSMDEHTDLERGFSQPNVVVLQKGELAAPSGPLRPGTPDNWFVHEKGLITKAPVRVLSLAALALSPDNTLWDLGAGSGSVGIEATLFLPDGFVYAVEKNQGRVEQIKVNVERFKVKNLSVTQAELPDGLGKLPAPDRVFIGGSGKHLDQVLDAVATVLNPEGRIVVNTVLIETLHLAVSVLEKKGFDVSLTQAQISQSRNMPWGRRMEALNPVWIIAAEKGKV
ncbi:bifunctional cobalt-precorrin-7 (C(5))-methyltransferase/cobalt-precorrin-6B (C(15))-methyltransferase [Desulfobacter vibrioformis]|uniref:bifunctional cobalt-precorrin-7 (C(5))-methyltransferase/cobalt-precorrin-6B (C(15))-methyltransferase n=1 Tax=Desulfobacter vibrioformis TaxID=34031 RepID=UPI0005599E66|nr:bifunctional cobalt-precorrin-7 (C(5))-methyltransferase/cobalt-precorrin-6B (C(15))-methyltransferase [Desulfobacter vibrioformis]